MFYFSKKSDRLKKKIEELENEIDELKDKKKDAEISLEKAQASAKKEKEDIKHLVKMKEEKNAIEWERKEMELVKNHQQEIFDVKVEYQNKVELNLSEQIATTKEMYAQILKRLPDVNVRLKGDV